MGSRPVVLRLVNSATGATVAERIVRVSGIGGRALGLLARRAPGPGEGVWLVPCGAVHTFGMRFSLDILFLDRSLQTLGIRTAIRPNRIVPAPRGTHSVIEMPAGSSLESVRTGERLAMEPGES